MAILRMTFRSRELKRDVPVNVVLPFDRGGAKPYPTLYLLHGLQNSCDTWPLNTRIERWASDRGLAVVMPQGENSFWLPVGGPEYPYGDFSAYVTDELVQVTRDEFCLSRERSRTFIGGFSMGGYGALRNGLKYHHTFGAIAALSSADIIQQIATFTDDNPAFFARRGYAQALFGPLEKLPGSDKDLRWLAQRITNPADRPRIYLACGSQDGLLPMNKNLRDSLQTLGYDLTWCEAPGAHEWDFWDSQIRRVIDWLSPGQADAGVNSGNVGV